MFLSQDSPLLDSQDQLIQEFLSFIESEEPLSSNSGSEFFELAEAERKRRRMISNRESAKRSRLKKKRHVENLTVEATRLGFQNQELKNQLNLVVNQCHLASRENLHLRNESCLLRTRLLNLHKALIRMQYGMSL